MPQISIHIDNIDKVKREFQRKPREVTKEVDTALDRAAHKIENDAKQNAPGNTGALQESIKAQRRGIARHRVIVNSEYGIYVHEGTKPHWPPFSENTALADWAQNKGLPPFAVAKSIAEDGTEAQPFLREAVEDNERYVNNRLSAALKRAV